MKHVIVSNIVYKQLNNKIMDPFKVKDPRPGIASVSTAKKMSKTPAKPQAATAAAAKKERKGVDVRRKRRQRDFRNKIRNTYKSGPVEGDIKGG